MYFQWPWLWPRYHVLGFGIEGPVLDHVLGFGLCVLDSNTASGTTFEC